MFTENNAELNLSEIIQKVDLMEQAKNDLPPLKIAFLHNIMIDPIVPYLKFLCFEEGFYPNIYLGDYDNVMQSILDVESSFYRHQADIVVLCVKLENLSEKLFQSFTSLSVSEVQEESDRILGYFEQAIGEIRKHSKATILVHNFEILAYPSFGVLDYQCSSKQINTIRQINLKLVDLINKYENAFIVDLDLLQSNVGYHNFIDRRYWQIGKLPYTRQATEVLAKEYMKFIRARMGKNRKCLVLDCDNTLWGGILGEDGIGGIKIGKTYPGIAYFEFQQAILSLYHRGILLAICSKNNEADVLEVFRDHPEMVLRENHFAILKINWKDKVANLKEIADELNIGLDSFVFMDDSEFEANMVKNCLPQVKTVSLPNDPTLYRDILNSLGFFDSLAFSEEDKVRSAMYQAEAQRKKVKTQFEDLDEYYRYLEIEVDICSADEFSVGRIAQLTQRTNQFNLTTKRYTETDIKSFNHSPEHAVLYLKYKDRFGDAGIVGVVILAYTAEYALIDTFLLSCRVIGRGIEDVLLKACLERAKKANKQTICGLYLKGKKNGQVADFYRKRGFTLDSQDENEAKFGFSLEKPIFCVPAYFKAIRTQ